VTDNKRKYNWNDEVKEGVMGRACRTKGAKRITYRILVRNLEGRNH
jgi:hypothetical protein